MDKGESLWGEIVIVGSLLLCTPIFIYSWVKERRLIRRREREARAGGTQEGSG